jgi:polar amino acid transport system ATP-binding protein
MNRAAMITVQRLSKSFGHLEVLKDLSFDVPNGTTSVLLGRSGSGKSTMLRCINLLEHWHAGEIFIDGQRLGKDTLPGGAVRAWSTRQEAALRRRVGMVFQQFNLFPHMTVLQNVMVGPERLQRIGSTESKALALALLEQVGLSDKRDQYPAFLSGGQQQRVAIARALAMKPDILLLDEVTSALDPELVGEVLEVIVDLKRRGLTMVCVTHEMHFAEDVADEVIFMESGVVVERGTPRQVLHNPQTGQMQKFLSRFHQGRDRETASRDPREN